MPEITPDNTTEHQEAAELQSDRNLLQSLIKRTDTSADSPWLISYSDLVTLLLTFFILIASFSKVDLSRFEQVATSISKAIGKSEEPKVSLEELYTQINGFIEDADLKDKLHSEITPIGVSISISGGYLFRSGSAELSAKAIPLLKRLSLFVNKVTYEVAIEGHTDDVPIQSAQYASNWELSTARASGIVRLFISQGVAPDRMRAVGFAETRPVAEPVDPGTHQPVAENRAKNRRVVVQFLAF